MGSNPTGGVNLVGKSVRLAHFTVGVVGRVQIPLSAKLIIFKIFLKKGCTKLQTMIHSFYKQLFGVDKLVKSSGFDPEVWRFDPFLRS
ncbi:hypothetical protein [Bacillus phage BC-T25]|nr:hypothetical protein [Bacillus phage BC-T25]